MTKNRFVLGADSPVTCLVGIGPKKAEALAHMGIHTLWDLIMHYPRAYENRGDVRTVRDMEEDTVCSLVLTVSARPVTATVKRGMVLTKLSAFDDTGVCRITYFNQPYIKDFLHEGETYRFYGHVKRAKIGVQMTSPVCERIQAGTPLPPLSALYSLSTGISQKQMGAAVSSALSVLLSPAAEDGVKETLPLSLRQKYGLCDIGYALRGVHAPDSFSTLETAKKRIAFEELFDFVLLLRLSGREEKKRAETAFSAPDRSRFLSLVPYAPTGAQTRTFSELDADLSSGFQMNRLLTGDVGSGKTLCAAYALFCACENGRQAALLAPTEILATQHYETLCPLFEKLGYKTALLTGSVPRSAKNKIYDLLATGSIDVVIGTHALLEEAVSFARLGLCVIDEQHRFGAAQRLALIEKGSAVHVLSMSATPIPRTLALVLYGDFALSTLDEMPPNRRKTDTYVVDESYRERLNGFIRKNVQEGGQVYIVCPAVEEQEQLESENGEAVALSALFGGGLDGNASRLKSAVLYEKNLRETVFPDFEIALIHGKMKGAEKDRIMSDFAAGRIQILVSTTVIEVGVNVPNASLMIVENADHFGLSQLHQLRGRVGRGNRKSYCILVSESSSPDAQKRLSLLHETNDGYRIAEEDLAMRGPGDFIEQRTGKIRQSGEFALVGAGLGNTAMLYEAAAEADALLAKDPSLSAEQNQALHRKIRYLRDKNQLI